MWALLLAGSILTSGRLLQIDLQSSSITGWTVLRDAQCAFGLQRLITVDFRHLGAAVMSANGIRVNSYFESTMWVASAVVVCSEIL